MFPLRVGCCMKKNTLSGVTKSCNNTKTNTTIYFLNTSNLISHAPEVDMQKNAVSQLTKWGISYMIELFKTCNMSIFIAVLLFVWLIHAVFCTSFSGFILAFLWDKIKITIPNSQKKLWVTVLTCKAPNKIVLCCIVTLYGCCQAWALLKIMHSWTI